MKASKASVDYSEGKPDGDRCGNCKHFERKKGTCTEVLGDIKAKMWCSLYKRAGKGKDDEASGY